MDETKKTQSTKEALNEIIKNLQEYPDLKLTVELESLVSKDSISEAELAQIMEKIKNHLITDLELAEENLNTSRGNICSLVGIDTFNEDVVLEFVNENRQILGGEPLKTLNSATIKSGIRAPDSNVREWINLDLLERDLENLPDSDFLDEIALLQSEFRKLYSEGGDSERAEELSSEISVQVKNKISSVDEVIEVSKLLKLDSELYFLMVWSENLLRMDRAIESGNYRGEPLPLARDLGEIGNRILTEAEKRGQSPSPEVIAGVNLNWMEVDLKFYEESLKKRDDMLLW
ncbi:hypothetical protein [Methanobacterium formicicum]|uniref:SMC domain-containing protein n=1 Tax=Methanobacterium formicicum (strain DSM 3637 / PP1) TaxID=1204725 RepID=K2RDY8_METFP|nr:hypothetical protein [Methanobacterium formicicum]EKF86564.1 SMC domain-containing protein [Methanobacterium formicicum DSM 3637]